MHALGVQHMTDREGAWHWLCTAEPLHWGTAFTLCFFRIPVHPCKSHGMHTSLHTGALAALPCSEYVHTHLLWLHT